MKNEKKLATGQIVGHKSEWLVVIVVGGNVLLLPFNKYMKIYNYGLTPANILTDDELIASAIGVDNRFASSLEGFLGGFANESDLIITDQFVKAVKL